MDIPYIPYFQTSRYKVATMIELADIKPGEKAADLGTGDGRIAIALAKAGAAVTAFELDDERIKEAQKNIDKAFSSRHSERSEESNSKNSEGFWINQNHSLEKRSFSNTQAMALEQQTYRDDKNIALPTILKKDFWFEDLSQFSIICCYPMPTIMGRLEKKIQQELHPGARVLLNYFPFLHWKLATKKDNIFLYRK